MLFLGATGLACNNPPLSYQVFTLGYMAHIY